MPPDHKEEKFQPKKMQELCDGPKKDFTNAEEAKTYFAALEAEIRAGDVKFIVLRRWPDHCIEAVFAACLKAGVEKVHISGLSNMAVGLIRVQLQQVPQQDRPKITCGIDIPEVWCKELFMLLPIPPSEQGQILYARELLDSCNIYLNETPKDADFVSTRGVALFMQAKHQEAIAEFTKAIALESSCYAKMARYQRGLVLLEQAKYEEAAIDFRANIKVMPNSALLFYKYAITQYMQDNYELALQSLNRSIALDADYADAYFQRGIIFCHQKNYEFAKKDLTRAIELNPAAPEPYYQRGLIFAAAHTSEGNEAALSDFNKIIALKPNCIQANLSRGNVLAECKKYDEAAADFHKVLTYVELRRRDAKNDPYMPHEEENLQLVEMGALTAFAQIQKYLGVNESKKTTDDAEVKIKASDKKAAAKTSKAHKKTKRIPSSDELQDFVTMEVDRLSNEISVALQRFMPGDNNNKEEKNNAEALLYEVSKHLDEITKKLVQWPQTAENINLLINKVKEGLQTFKFAEKYAVHAELVCKEINALAMGFSKKEAYSQGAILYEQLLQLINPQMSAVQFYAILKATLCYLRIQPISRERAKSQVVKITEVAATLNGIDLAAIKGSLSLLYEIASVLLRSTCYPEVLQIADVQKRLYDLQVALGDTQKLPPLEMLVLDNGGKEFKNTEEAKAFFYKQEEAIACSGIKFVVLRNWAVQSIEWAFASCINAVEENDVLANKVVKKIHLSFLSDDALHVISGILERVPLEHRPKITCGIDVSQKRQEEFFRLSGLSSNEYVNEIINTCDICLKSSPDNVEYLFLRGKTLFLLRHDQEAINLFNKVMAVDASYKADACYQRGLVYLQQGNYKAAAKDFKAAIQVAPKSAMAHYQYGRTLLNQKNVIAALRSFTTAIDLDSNFADAYHQRGFIFYEQKDDVKAKADFDAAILRGTTFIDSSYYQRALIFSSSKTPEACEAAIVDFTKVIELRPDSHYAYYGRAEIFSAQKNYTAAVADYNKTLELIDLRIKSGSVCTEKEKQNLLIVKVSALASFVQLKENLSSNIMPTVNAQSGVKSAKIPVAVAKVEAKVEDKERKKKVTRAEAKKIAQAKYEVSIKGTMTVAPAVKLQNEISAASRRCESLLQMLQREGNGESKAPDYAQRLEGFKKITPNQDVLQRFRDLETAMKNELEAPKEKGIKARAKEICRGQSEEHKNNSKATNNKLTSSSASTIAVQMVASHPSNGFGILLAPVSVEQKQQHELTPAVQEVALARTHCKAALSRLLLKDEVMLKEEKHSRVTEKLVLEKQFDWIGQQKVDPQETLESYVGLEEVINIEMEYRHSRLAAKFGLRPQPTQAAEQKTDTQPNLANAPNLKGS